MRGSQSGWACCPRAASAAGAVAERSVGISAALSGPRASSAPCAACHRTSLVSFRPLRKSSSPASIWNIYRYLKQHLYSPAVSDGMADHAHKRTIPRAHADKFCCDSRTLSRALFELSRSLGTRWSAFDEVSLEPNPLHVCLGLKSIPPAVAIIRCHRDISRRLCFLAQKTPC
jgi:hypothetical protein